MALCCLPSRDFINYYCKGEIDDTWNQGKNQVACSSLVFQVFYTWHLLDNDSSSSKRIPTPLPICPADLNDPDKVNSFINSRRSIVDKTVKSWRNRHNGAKPDFHRAARVFLDGLLRSALLPDPDQENSYYHVLSMNLGANIYTEEGLTKTGACHCSAFCSSCFRASECPVC